MSSHVGYSTSLLTALALLLGGLASPACAGIEYDVVIAHGRVMDPESGYDARANVGIQDGIIRAISRGPLRGRTIIDATAKVVAPGFIDLHAHGQSRIANELQARDGVTTALELELGSYPVSKFYAAREGRAPINFGASVSHQGIRILVKTGNGPAASGDVAASAAQLRGKDIWAESAMTDAELTRALAIFSDEVAAGGLGLGLATEYVPGANRVEAYRFMRQAAALKVPVFTHVRAAYTAAPGGPFEMMQEVIANAAATGVSLHICHVTSKGLNDTALILEAIAGARKSGIDVTTEAYPYTAGNTLLGSALFNDGWQQRWNADYGDVEWAATGERLTAESFARYRREQPSGAVNFHMIPEAAMDLAISDPSVLIASDGSTFFGGYGHPRGAGTFSRVLGQYVRERKLLTLMTALRKMTLMPAQRVERVAPDMRRKGRLQVGMDADVTIFDPAKIIDRATYMKPMLPSEGVTDVLVAGVAVVSNSQTVSDVSPGRAIRGLIRTNVRTREGVSNP